MRREDLRQDQLLSYVSIDERIPANHPLRKLRVVVNAILASMNGAFAPLYSDVGRPSIAPEQLFRALLLQILYTVRSERQLMEQMNYNLTKRLINAFASYPSNNAFFTVGLTIRGENAPLSNRLAYTSTRKPRKRI